MTFEDLAESNLSTYLCNLELPPSYILQNLAALLLLRRNGV